MNKKIVIFLFFLVISISGCRGIAKSTSGIIKWIGRAFVKLITIEIIPSWKSSTAGILKHELPILLKQLENTNILIGVEYSDVILKNVTTEILVVDGVLGNQEIEPQKENINIINNRVFGGIVDFARKYIEQSQHLSGNNLKIKLGKVLEENINQFYNLEYNSANYTINYIYKGEIIKFKSTLNVLSLIDRWVTPDSYNKMDITITNPQIEASIIEKKNINNELLIFAKKNNIGIIADNYENYASQYYKAANIRVINFSHLKEQILQDFNNNIYYSYSKENDNYQKCLKSKNIKGLLYKYSIYTKNNILDLESNLLLKKVQFKKIHLLNFISEYEYSKDQTNTFNTLKSLFHEKYTDFSKINILKFKQYVSKNNIKYIVCFGHFKDGKINTMSQFGIIEYDIDFIAKLAKNMNIELIFLGCNSSFSTSKGVATTKTMYTISALENLYNSFQTSETMGQFLNEISNKDTDYTYTYSFDVETELEKFRAQSSNYNTTQSIDDSQISIEAMGKPIIYLRLPPVLLYNLLKQDIDFDNNDRTERTRY